MEQPHAPRSAAELWASFPHDPRDPAVAPLRASDADRDLVAQVLVEAFADGRLNREEYDERSATVMRTRTLGELPPLVADLVPDRPLLGSASGRVPLVAASPTQLQQQAEEAYRDHLRNAFVGFLGSAVFFGAIAAFTTWWVLVVPLLALVKAIKTASNKKDIVRSELRRLEKRQAKALEARTRSPEA